MLKIEIEISFRGIESVERLASILDRVVCDHLVDGDDYLFVVMPLANISTDLKKDKEVNDNAKNDMSNL